MVADGAGGHSAGNVASAIATTALGKHFDSTKADYESKPEVDAFGLWTGARRLAAGIHRANAAVMEIARSSNKFLGMGTHDRSRARRPEQGRIHVAHVGDSRCYRLRSRAVELLTNDHSIFNDVVELHPELDDEALAKLPRKAVTRALGMEPTVRASVRTLRVLVGDRYLLCSDGLTGEIGHSRALREMLAQTNKPAEMVADLVRSAKEAGGRDNITALVIDCQAAPEDQRFQKPSPPPLPRKNPLAHPKGDPPETTVGTGTPRVDPEIVLIRAKSGDTDEPRISVVPTAKADETSSVPWIESPGRSPGRPFAARSATRPSTGLRCSVPGAATPRRNHSRARARRRRARQCQAPAL